MDSGHSSEYISAHWGALRAGHSVKVLPSTSVSSIESLKTMILDEQPSILLISPNQSTYIEDSDSYLKKKDILNQALPQLFQSSTPETIGQPIFDDSLPDLRFVIQTGFYNIPGYVKFRDMLVYRSNKYNTSSKVPEFPFKNSSKKADSKCPIQSFNSQLMKQLGTQSVENSIVYNLLDLQDDSSVHSLLGCLSLAQEKELFTNIVPSQNLDELLLEKRFLQDLTQNHNSLIVGTSESLNKVQEAIGFDIVKYLNVSSQ